MGHHGQWLWIFGELSGPPVEVAETVFAERADIAGIEVVASRLIFDVARATFLTKTYTWAFERTQAPVAIR